IDAKWAWRWVTPCSRASIATARACSASPTPAPTSSSRCAPRERASCGSSIAAPQVSHRRRGLEERPTWITGAGTRASAGWKRASAGGRREKMTISSPAASRARISETMNVSEKRGYIFSTYAMRWGSSADMVGHLRVGGDGGGQETGGEPGDGVQPVEVDVAAVGAAGDGASPPAGDLLTGHRRRLAGLDRADRGQGEGAAGLLLASAAARDDQCGGVGGHDFRHGVVTAHAHHGGGLGDQFGDVRGAAHHGGGRARGGGQV